MEMRTLLCPPARHFACFFSRYSGHFVQNPDSNTIERHCNEGKERNSSSIEREHENFLLNCSQIFFRFVRPRKKLYFSAVFHMFRDKTIFFLVLRFYRLSLLRARNIPNLTFTKKFLQKL